MKRIKTIVKELVLAKLKCKLNITLTCKFIKYSSDSNIDKIVEHHFKNPAKAIPAENWFDDVYKEIVEIIMKNFVQLTVKQSGLALHSIEQADIHLSEYVQPNKVDTNTGHYQLG